MAPLACEGLEFGVTGWAVYVEGLIRFGRLVTRFSHVQIEKMCTGIDYFSFVAYRRLENF